MNTATYMCLDKLHIIRYLSLLLLLSFWQNERANCQNESFTKIVAFYNVENFFDTYNDTSTNDDEFTPEGLKHWTNRRMTQKASGIYKTIMAMGQGKPVSIIGISEVENKFCLKKLLTQTPIQRLNYKYIHYDSPDKRGIDVALIYNPVDFVALQHHPMKIVLPGDETFTTRDVLYVKGVLCNTDTLHIFVCHLPSRLGGKSQSAYKRNFVADIIRAHTDSIITKNKDANIIVMGDMNDDPDDESMHEHLCTDNSHLVNMMAGTIDKDKKWTLKYGADANVFDQIIVSENMTNTSSKIYVENAKGHVGDMDFLLTKDKKYGGRKPFRTYSGPKYLGGYSDHLPVYVEVKCKQR